MLLPNLTFCSKKPVITKVSTLTQNQQPQAWHEGLELDFNVVDRFNIQSSNKMWAHSKYWACSNYIFRIHIGLKDELMEAL